MLLIVYNLATCRVAEYDCLYIAAVSFHLELQPLAIGFLSLSPLCFGFISFGQARLDAARWMSWGRFRVNHIFSLPDTGIYVFIEFFTFNYDRFYTNRFVYHHLVEH